jgi:ATP-dependent Clp protease ATP-binding subunit ClpA
MFERFTERARKVVVLSREEARRLGHGYIGIEHLLLGLPRLNEGVAALVLSNLGAYSDRVRHGAVLSGARRWPVTVAELRRPVVHEVSGVSVEAAFVR